MTETVAQRIRNDIIAQDIRYRRADAAVRNDVDARLDKLEKSIVAMMLKIDVNGTKQVAARQRRLKKLNFELGVLIRTAYSEINGLLRAAGRRIAKVEAQNINKIVAENLP